MTITEFLLARIGEDEAVARIDPDDWRFWHDLDGSGEAAERQLHTARCGVLMGEFMEKCECNARARILAECAAKRGIVEAYEDERQRKNAYNRGYDEGQLNEADLRRRLSSNARYAGLEIAVLSLASVYADHPDYQPEWAL